MPLVLDGHLKGLLDQPVHFFATLWRIERTDGTVFRFTDHNVPLPFTYTTTEETYQPAGGFDGSAREKQSGIRDHNMEAVGVIDSVYITDEDLRAGKYLEAKVIEILVDHRYPYATPFLKNIYYIAGLSYNQEIWRAQISGQPVWLRQAIGTVLNRNCRHRLGQGICGQGVNLASYQISGVAVTSIQDRRRVFTASSLAQAAGYFARGTLTWVTGPNTGITQDIIEHDTGGKLFLPTQAPFEVAIGNTFNIVPGCDLTIEVCFNKFNNVVNFGGYPDLPGTDKVIGGLVP